MEGCFGYQQFFQKLKSKKKKNKQERKENLRQGAYKKIVQSSEESNDEHIIKKTLKQGHTIWQKINRSYFKHLDSDLVENMKQLTTSEDILHFGDRYSRLLPYYQSIIFASEPYIFQDHSLRIVFRRQFRVNGIEDYQLVGYELKQTEMKPMQDNKLQPNQRILSFHIPTQSVPKPNKNLDLNNDFDLSILGTCKDSNFIVKCLKYESIWRREEVDEVDKEIECWKEELQEQHKINIEAWEELENKIDKENIQKEREEEMEEKLNSIRRFLMRNQTFTYFRAGYSDKTFEQLEKAIEYMKEDELLQNYEKKKPALFQTDCKICFSTKNDPNNRVIYCDDCNTSFHQSCYGIENITEGEFYCDVCAFGHREGDEKSMKVEKPFCQICSRNKFPIKKIKNHFYHVACLVLFNFADIKDFQIKLKPNFDHNKIISTVIENQLQHGSCEFCPKNGNLGMQFKCVDPLCARSYHPICAYLNGCYFDIRRDEHQLLIEVYCQEHKKRETDLISQIYMRRFFCNYKKTVKISEEEFTEKYKEEESKRLKIMEKEVQELGIKRILKKTKTIKPVLEKGKDEGEVVKEPNSKKVKEQKVEQKVDISTQTGKLLKSLKCLSKW